MCFCTTMENGRQTILKKIIKSQVSWSPGNAIYDEFLTLVYTTLELEREKSAIKLVYQVHNGSPRLQLQNDNRLKFYLQLKRRTTNVTQYPLCVSFESLYSTSPIGACPSQVTTWKTDHQNKVVLKEEEAVCCPYKRRKQHMQKYDKAEF